MKPVAMYIVDLLLRKFQTSLNSKYKKVLEQQRTIYGLNHDTVTPTREHCIICYQVCSN